jgi:hypothetical protein
LRLLNRSSDCRGCDGVEFGVEPELELREMLVAWREQSVVLQHAAEVLDVSARSCRGETVVGERYCPGGDSAEQLQYLNIAFPGEDALGPVHSAEHFHEGFHGSRIGGMVQKDCAQVSAECASGAFAAAVDLAFVSAGSAGETGGDAGAGQADRPRIGAVEAAGKHSVVSAVRSDAVGAHRGVEAAVAELIAGPVDPQFVGFAVASAAFLVACGDGRPAAAGGAWCGVNRRHR